MSRLLNEELSEIRERAEKATEGKWYYEIDGDLYSEKARERVMYPYLTAESIPYIKVSKEDAAFIAHAREDIPKLLAEVDRLNKIIEECGKDLGSDRKSTRLNSSHVAISYAVFCLKKKNICK